MSAKTEKKVVDWEAMEPHYRAGAKSLSQLASEFGCSDAAIVKHAKKHGWSRDKAAQVRAKADEKVRAATVSESVRAQRAQTKAKHQEAVLDAEAEVQSQVRLRHRSDIRRLRNLAAKLTDELEQQTDNLPLYQELGELLRSPNDNGVDKLNDLYHKVISTGSRVSAVKQLAEILEKIIKLEREAFGIDREEGSASPLDEMLKRVSAHLEGK